MSKNSGFKRFFLGEPMPDKDDPKYKKRHEEAFAAGEKFAQYTGLSWLGEKYFTYGQQNTRQLVVIMMSILIAGFILFMGNLGVRISKAHSGKVKGTAVERVDSALNHHHHSVEHFKKHKQ